MNWMELSIVVNHEVEYDVTEILESYGSNGVVIEDSNILEEQPVDKFGDCLLYTSPSPRDVEESRMPSSA